MNVLVTRLLGGLAIAVAIAALGCAAYFAYCYRHLPGQMPEQRPHAPAVAAIAATQSAAIEPAAWQRLRPAALTSSAAGPLSDRFRLAGTFFLYAEDAGGGDAATRSRAIIDDLSAKRQMLVQTGDEIDGYRVNRIERERVALQKDGVEYEITLSFSAVTAELSSTGTAGQSPEPPNMEDLPALESTRFGKRVGENRWVMRREELLRYYAEVLEDPERIANVYASLKPLYDDEKKITGYYLNAEGEADFFRAIGLQEGDVIRRVNSMRMVSQRRAEYFISEFMKNRVSALVFDVERGEKEDKLIYLIR